MTQYVLIVVALVLSLFIVSTVSAGDVEAKVQSVNAGDRTITLDNGTTIWAGDGVSLDTVREGAVVRVVYEEKDGKPVATVIEVK